MRLHNITFAKGANFTRGKSEHMNHPNLRQIGLTSELTTKKAKQFKNKLLLFREKIKMAENRVLFERNHQ